MNIIVHRGRKGSRERETIAGTITQQDYAAMFNSVDRNDRDSADYSTTVRTHRFYIHFFGWLIDRVIHTIFVVVVSLVSSDKSICQDSWKCFLSKNGGRKKFQIRLGLDLMYYAISKAWDGKSERPDWMRQTPFVPCDCAMCYFCLNGHTTGIMHREKYTKVKVVYEKTGSIVRADECVTDAVDLGRGCAYCKMCFRKLIGATDADGKKLTYKQKKKLVKNSSRKGCPQSSCNEHICKECWADGYDKHWNNK